MFKDLLQKRLYEMECKNPSENEHIVLTDQMRRNYEKQSENPPRTNFTHRTETSRVKAGNTRIGKRPPYLTSRR